MTSKVIIGILVFLLIFTGCVCTYSYILGKQVDALITQVTSFQQQQEGQISAIHDAFLSFEQEMSMRTDALEGDINTTTNRIDLVENNIAGVHKEISQSLLNANRVYEKTLQAIVRINNGERTVGSGFLFETKNHIVTAHHVVEHLSEIYIVFPSGKVLAAKLVGGCKYSDVAVLALEDQLDIDPLIFANSTAVQVGDPVVSVGNPFELTETLTAGVISHTNRYAEIQYDSSRRHVSNLIQFDAPANFGNSGCPLLNSQGEVIRMVIARIKPDRGDGVYYAISSNKVSRVASSIIEKGSFDHPWLGIEIANLTPRTVLEKGLETIRGVLVKKVLANSPAQVAGVKTGDIIVSIDEITPRGVSDLTSHLGLNKSPDDLATLKLIRDTVRLELTVTLGKRQP